MAYIRKAYNVPAKRGARIRMTLDGNRTYIGTIKSAKNGSLRVQFDGVNYVSTIHPTWHIEYLSGG